MLLKAVFSILPITAGQAATTKPTGQVTGLGFSLSFDIVKAHGGTVDVCSDKGQGGCFTIMIPAK